MDKILSPFLYPFYYCSPLIWNGLFVFLAHFGRNSEPARIDAGRTPVLVLRLFSFLPLCLDPFDEPLGPFRQGGTFRLRVDEEAVLRPVTLHMTASFRYGDDSSRILVFLTSHFHDASILSLLCTSA